MMTAHRIASVFVAFALTFGIMRSVNAQLPELGEGGIGNVSWDASTLQVVSTSGVIVNAAPTEFCGISLTAVVANGDQSGTFQCFMLSTDHTRSIFIDGDVDSGGQISYDYYIADSAGTTAYSQLSGSNALAARGFWGDYWHYLTHPWEMDDDLETGFYVAVGTSAVAGTVAGGMVIAGVDVVLWGGAAAGGAAAAGTTAIPEGTGMVGWVVGDEIVAISLPNTSHAVLGTQVGAVVDGVAVEGAYAFTVIKEGGEIVVLGSQNFGGVLSVPTFVINLVKAAVH